MKNLIYSIAALLLFAEVMYAQDEPLFKEADVVKFDKKVHDFGDVLIAEGPISCTFTLTNISSKPIVIHNVVSSCGCTTPDWTREPIRPGAKASINAVFSNDQGPYPFDKTLTVYISSIDRPVVLRIRGVSHEQKKDLDELFTNRIGNMGIRKMATSIGYVDQGVAKSDNIQIANLGKSEMKVEAASATPGISITVSPNPIPARSMAKLTYTLDPTAMGRTAWGKQNCEVTFRLNGKTYPEKFSITGIIKDNFETYTKEQLNNAAIPVVDKSYFEFGEIKKGATFEATYVIKNKGKSELKIYDIAGANNSIKVMSPLPLSVKAGGKTSVKVKFDSSKLDYTGEVIEIMTVITNSPTKPIINLFITGNVK